MIRKDPAIEMDEDISREPPCLLSVTLRCIADVMKSKIIARNGDAIGIIAFGARGRTARQGWPGVRVVRALKASDADGVKLLQNLAQRIESGEAEGLLSLSDEEIQQKPVSKGDELFCFGSDTSTEFDKALWAARHQFTAMSASRVSVLHRKRVFVFTNDDDPSRGNHAIRKQSESQMKDLADMGAVVEVSILLSPSLLTDSTASDATGSSEFFNNLIYTDEDTGSDEKGSVTIATVYSFEDLRTRVRRKEMQKRAMRKTVLILGPDYKIGVLMYALVRRAKRPQKIELVASTDKPVFKITTNTCEAFGEILKPEGIRLTFKADYLKEKKYTTPGAPLEGSEAEESEAGQGDQVIPKVHGFTKAEVLKAKALGNVGLHLYGFRKKHLLKPEHILGPPSFLFPDDSEYSGSTQAFSTLLKCMLQRNVIAIVSVRLNMTSATGMRFAALLPQQEVFAEDIEKSLPGGFQMHYLPYMDDVYTAWRKELNALNEEVKVESKEDGLLIDYEDELGSVGIARKIVKKLELEPYSPNHFLNPDLQRFYTGLENAAGIESTYQPQDELLNPKVEEMQERAQSDMEALKIREAGIDFDGDAEAERFGTKSSKRAAEQAEAAAQRAAKKRAAKESAQEECVDSIYIKKYRDGTLGKMKKQELQLFCRAHGLEDKGNKPNLIITVEDHIKEQLLSSEANGGDSA